MVPSTTGAPFKISFVITDGVVSPAVIVAGVSFTASTKLDTTTVRVAVASAQPPVPVTV